MQASRPRRPLEPLAAVCVLSVLAHVLAAAGLAYLLLSPDAWPQSRSLVWFAPADFEMSRPLTVPVPPEPPAPKAKPSVPAAAPPAAETPPAGPMPPPAAKTPSVERTPPAPEEPPAPAQAAARSVAKMIKISLVPPAGTRQEPPRRPVVTLLDVARLGAQDMPGEMDAILVELQGSLMDVWQPPELRSGGRPGSVVLRFRLLKDSTVGSLLMQHSSGSHELDASVLAAAGRVKKISFAMPANFPETGYDVEATFQIE